MTKSFAAIGGEGKYRSYNDYLGSPEWHRRRREALDRASARCQLCNSAQQLQVHHRTYERIGCEKPEDLTVLCSRCHTAFHSRRKLVSKPPTSKHQIASVVIAALEHTNGPFRARDLAQFCEGLDTRAIGLLIARRRQLIDRGTGKTWIRKDIPGWKKTGSHRQSMTMMIERNKGRKPQFTGRKLNTSKKEIGIDASAGAGGDAG